MASDGDDVYEHDTDYEVDLCKLLVTALTPEFKDDISGPTGEDDGCDAEGEHSDNIASAVADEFRSCAQRPARSARPQGHDSSSFEVPDSSADPSNSVKQISSAMPDKVANTSGAKHGGNPLWDNEYEKLLKAQQKASVKFQQDPTAKAAKKLRKTFDATNEYLRPWHVQSPWRYEATDERTAFINCEHTYSRADDDFAERTVGLLRVRRSKTSWLFAPTNRTAGAASIRSKRNRKCAAQLATQSEPYAHLLVGNGELRGAINAAYGPLSDEQRDTALKPTMPFKDPRDANPYDWKADTVWKPAPAEPTNPTWREIAHCFDSAKKIQQIRPADVLKQKPECRQANNHVRKWHALQDENDKLRLKEFEAQYPPIDLSPMRKPKDCLSSSEFIPPQPATIEQNECDAVAADLKTSIQRAYDQDQKRIAALASAVAWNARKAEELKQKKSKAAKAETAAIKAGKRRQKKKELV